MERSFPLEIFLKKKRNMFGFRSIPLFSFIPEFLEYNLLHHTQSTMLLDKKKSWFYCSKIFTGIYYYHNYYILKKYFLKIIKKNLF